LRHPDAMSELRAAAQCIWEGGGEDYQERYEAIRGPGDPAAFDELHLVPRRSARCSSPASRGLASPPRASASKASPHVGGFCCAASQTPGEQVATHLMEDVQIWEVVDAESKAPLPDGQRGLTVCTNLNSAPNTSRDGIRHRSPPASRRH
jgi:hypothetical protein